MHSCCNSDGGPKTQNHADDTYTTRKNPDTSLPPKSSGNRPQATCQGEECHLKEDKTSTKWDFLKKENFLRGVETKISLSLWFIFLPLATSPPPLPQAPLTCFKWSGSTEILCAQGRTITLRSFEKAVFCCTLRNNTKKLFPHNRNAS